MMTKIARIIQSAALIASLSACGGASVASTSARATRFEGPPVTALTLPAGDDEGRPIEPGPLLDAPHLKLMTIILRDGAVLPEHRASSPVTIQAVSGSGVARIGDETHRLDANHFVSLAPGVPHAVEPDAGTDMVLLVHYLRGGHEDEGGR